MGIPTCLAFRRMEKEDGGVVNGLFSFIFAKQALIFPFSRSFSRSFPAFAGMNKMNMKGTAGSENRKRLIREKYLWLPLLPLPLHPLAGLGMCIPF